MEQRSTKWVNSSYVITTVIFEAIATICLGVSLGTNYWVVDIYGSANAHGGLYKVCLDSEMYNDKCVGLDDSVLRYAFRDTHLDNLDDIIPVSRLTRNLCITAAALYLVAGVIITICACLKDKIPAAETCAWFSFTLTLCGVILNVAALIYYCVKITVEPALVPSYSLHMTWLAICFVLVALPCTTGVVRNRPNRILPTVAFVGGQQIVINRPGQIVHYPAFNQNPMGQILVQPAFNQNQMWQTPEQPAFNQNQKGQTPGQSAHNQNPIGQSQGQQAYNPNPTFENQSGPFETRLVQ